MGIFESNTVIFHGVTDESRAVIHSFLQGYLDLFKKHFGEDKQEGNVYIGGIPTYEFDLDGESGEFPREEGYYVLGISPRWAKARYWENNPGFVGIFLEQKLCTKITWYQYWDQEQPNRIYMNDSTENVPASWKYYEFVPGKNGVPAEYDEENEDDDGEAFNQFVNEVMKGEREVEWRDGFPDYWQDRYDELISEKEREEMDDLVFGFDDDAEDDDADEDGDDDFDEGKNTGAAATNDPSRSRADSGLPFDSRSASAGVEGKTKQFLQRKQDQVQDRLKARQQEIDRAMKLRMDALSANINKWMPSNLSTAPFNGQNAEIKDNKVCPHCHCPVASGMRFCENCGQKL